MRSMSLKMFRWQIPEFIEQEYAMGICYKAYRICVSNINAVISNSVRKEGEKS